MYGLERAPTHSKHGPVHVGLYIVKVYNLWPLMIVIDDAALTSIIYNVKLISGCVGYHEPLFNTFSISDQSVMMPPSTGYFKVRIPLLLRASEPTYESRKPSSAAMIRGTPQIERHSTDGMSCLANPALHMNEPLSIITAGLSILNPAI